MGQLTRLAVAGLAAAWMASCQTLPPVALAGAPCEAPPVLHCPDTDCPSEIIAAKGPVTDPVNGSAYFLDYPCNLKPGEDVVFILNLHGAGAPSNWHRHYFAAFDYKDKYRLVVATPIATDGAHLQRITDSVTAQIGRENIKSFWLAGHSAGGMASNRLVCTDYFKDKVDGWLSLSGGYIGEARRGPPPPCDFSFIYAVGEVEVTLSGAPLPQTSPWAEKYQCGARTRRPDIVDAKGGYVFDTATVTRPNPRRGGPPGPGAAEIYVYPGCKDGRIVADVVRLKKAHAEGLEPKITEELIKMMVSAKGGKLRSSGKDSAGGTP
jgi:hypothetical protein